MRILLNLLAFFLLFIGNSCAAEWMQCTNGGGVAFIRGDVRCEMLNRQDFVFASIDLEDPLTIDTIGQAREVVRSVIAKHDSPAQASLRNYLGEEFFMQLMRNGVSDIELISPDFSNTLGMNTYRLDFKRRGSVRVSIFIEPSVREHEWIRYIDDSE